MLACARGQQPIVMVPSKSRDITYQVNRYPPHCPCEAFTYHAKDHNGSPWCSHLEDVEAKACPWTEREYGAAPAGTCPRCGGPLEEEREEPHDKPIDWQRFDDPEAIARGLAPAPGGSSEPVPLHPELMGGTDDGARAAAGGEGRRVGGGAPAEPSRDRGGDADGDGDVDLDSDPMADGGGVPGTSGVRPLTRAELWERLGRTLGAE